MRLELLVVQTLLSPGVELQIQRHRAANSSKPHSSISFASIANRKQPHESALHLDAGEDCKRAKELLQRRLD